MKTDLKNWLVVIPARLESTRLPNKPLAMVASKPLIYWVHSQVAKLESYGADVVVAIDDLKTEEACKQFKIPFVQTSKKHKSGTDRVAEVAKDHGKDFILNVQGDEPHISVGDLAALMQRMEADSGKMGTLVFKTNDPKVLENPNRVKAIVEGSMAIDFCRSYSYCEDSAAGVSSVFLHVGVYAFQKEYLLTFCQLPQSEREKSLRLEQMRALDNGGEILTVEAEKFTTGIDTPEDLEAFRRGLNS